MSRISVSLDASQIPAKEREAQRIRVAAKHGDQITSQVVSVSSGKAEAKLDIEGSGAVTIAVGPESSHAAELFRRNTHNVVVHPQMVGGKLAHTVKPIVITPQLWEWWLIWCRSFTITGHVFGLDGNPVPSAQVSAFNVDWFWWWSSTQQVGPTATTDANGFFSITFEWCCGWWPWWWWEIRNWRLDPILVDKIQGVLQLAPDLHVGPPSPELSLQLAALNPQPLPPGPPERTVSKRSAVMARDLNPSNLPALREKMMRLLPSVPEFERICLWPWCDWWPWLECEPDIIFQVTQVCNGATNVIVNENVWQARPDIPTSLDVTLTANAQACTIPPPPNRPEGACFLFTGCCDVQPFDIGLTGSGALAGLAYPGSEDRPFTGNVAITGQFGYTPANLDYADYYAIQYRAEGTIPWLDVNPMALQGFDRTYFDSNLLWPNQWVPVPFPVLSLPLSGSPGTLVNVYESRQFYEVNSPPANWGDPLFGRSWTYNVDMIAAIDTAGFFVDGAYEFQIVGYTKQADGSIASNGALAGCGLPNIFGINDNNDFSLFFANPVVGQTNPDASILSVSFNGTMLPPCGIVTLPSGEPFSFEAVFTASDAEGYLDSYLLQLQWGANAPAALFSCGCLPGCGLSAGVGVEVGPCYNDAISQGAVRPNWSGGTMTLSIPNASAVFPQSCAYDLILSVYKRNIVDCDVDDYYQEVKYYSFTVLFQ